MPAFADRTTPRDRWAIVAYVRALQLSQNVPADRLPPGMRAALSASPRASASRANAPAPGASDPETS